MASAKLPVPNVDNFQPHPGEPPVPFRQWIKTFNRFLMMVNAGRPAADQLTSAQKNTYLYMLLGAEGRRRFDSNAAADQMDSMSYDNFRTAITGEFQEDVDEVTACFDFNRRDQGRNETTEEYLSMLKMMAVDCNFGNTADRQIAIRMICGCNSRETQMRLLAMKVLKLNDVVATMKAEERARANVAAISRNKPLPMNIVRQPGPQGRDGRRPPKKPAAATSSGECSNCGRSGHNRADESCPAKMAKCNYCDRKGHFAKCCRQRQRDQRSPPGQQDGRKQRGQVKTTTVAADDSPESDDAVLRIARTEGIHPILQEVEVSTGRKFKLVKMEIDSGAHPSTMSAEVYKKFFSECQLQPPEKGLRNFDHSKIQGLLGRFKTRIRLNSRVHQDYVHIVSDNCTSVLGRNFLEPLRVTIDCGSRRISTVGGDMAKTQNPLQRHPNLTRTELGTCPGEPHKIKLSEDAWPMAAKLRTVPLTRREATNDAIRAMERDKVWEKTDKSSWVHPLVAIPKDDNTIRVTTDLSALNSYVVPDRYPVPNIKDLLLEISGATIFSKIDLRKAYFNVELHPDSRDLTTTITPLGLYRYLKLPMGLKDAASAFQRRVSQALSGCEGVVVYIDDILVFGRTVEEHDK